MTFKVGDKVVCCNDDGYEFGYLFKGDSYLVVDKSWDHCFDGEVSLQSVKYFPYDFYLAESKEANIHAITDKALCEMFNYLRQNGVNPRVVEKHLEQKDALRLIYEAIEAAYNKERQ